MALSPFSTADRILVLVYAFINTSSRFSDVLLVTGRAGNRVDTGMAISRRRCFDQAAAKCAGLPEREVGTSLLQGALETLETLHVRQAQRWKVSRTGPGTSVVGPLGLGEGLVQDMLGVGQASKR